MDPPFLKKSGPPPFLASCLVVFLALASQCWVLALPFQLDDYSQVSSAPVRMHWLGDRLLGRASGKAPGGYLFRPALWGSFLLEQRLSGAVARPLFFHATSWLLHGFVCLLLWLLFKRILPLWPAFLGSLLFALDPAGVQAVSWVAARGDLLMTLFALLAAFPLLRFWRRKGDLWPAFLSGLALAAALLSKGPAVMLVPVVLAVMLTLPGSLSRRLLRAASCLLPLLLAWLLRSLYLGTLVPTYTAGISFTPKALPRMAAGAPSLLAELVVPWNLRPETHSSWPLLVRLAERLVPGLAASARDQTLSLGHLQAGVAVVWLICPALSLLLAPLRQGRRFLLMLPVFLLMALPLAFIWLPLEWSVHGRAFYPLAVFVAAGAACTFDVLLGPGFWRRGRRFLAFLFLGILLLVGGDALVHTARVNLEAGRRVRRELAEIQALAENAGRGTVLLVEGGPDNYAGLPLLGPLAEQAFEAPFHRPAVELHHVSPARHLDLLDQLAAIRAPLQLIRFRAGHYVPGGPRLPALPKGLPLLTQTDAAQPYSWRPLRPLPTRAVRALELSLGPGAGGVVELLLKTGHQVFKRRFTVLANPSPEKQVVALDNDLTMLLTVWLTSFRLLAPSGGDPLLRRLKGMPKLLARLPQVALLYPKEESLISFGNGLNFRVRGEAPGRGMRLSLQFLLGPVQYHLRCTFKAGQLRSAGQHRILLQPGPEVAQQSDYPGLNWSSLPGQLATLSSVFGINRLQVRWRVEVLSPGGRQVQARSPWGLFQLAR